MTPGVQAEQWERSEAVGVAVVQRVIPGINGIVTTDLSANIPHQWIRRGVATNDGATKDALTANEGKSSKVQNVNTGPRFGNISAWLVKTRWINPENAYNDLDPYTKIIGFEQIWQESSG